MIKLPEPVELNPAANSVMGHSDATLKQAVRDAYEEAMTTKDQAIANQRADFEAWCKVVGHDTTKDHKHSELYWYAETDSAWQAWKEANKPAPDCRTCDYRSLDSDENDYCLQKCTNGDQYQPAPAVVLWRTEP